MALSDRSKLSHPIMRMGTETERAFNRLVERQTEPSCVRRHILFPGCPGTCPKPCNLGGVNKFDGDWCVNIPVSEFAWDATGSEPERHPVLSHRMPVVLFVGVSGFDQPLLPEVRSVSGELFERSVGRYERIWGHAGNVAGFSISIGLLQ